MGTLNKEIGNLGENLAAQYLEKVDYTIIVRNFKCKIGEIDLIAKDTNYIVFVEVKTRYGSKYGNPCEAVTFSKQRKIIKAAQFYIMINKLEKSNFRFDVIEVTLNLNNSNSSFRLIRNAFQI